MSWDGKYCYYFIQSAIGRNGMRTGKMTLLLLDDFWTNEWPRQIKTLRELSTSTTRSGAFSAVGLYFIVVLSKLELILYCSQG